MELGLESIFMINSKPLLYGFNIKGLLRIIVIKQKLHVGVYNEFPKSI